MRLFEEFVEQLQRTPHKDYGGSFSVDGDMAQIKPGDAAVHRQQLKAEVLSKIENCHIFVLSMRAVFPIERSVETYEDGTVERMSQLESLDLEVAPPFQTCWFQFTEPGNGQFNGIKDRREGESLYGMFLHEIAPHEYLFAFVMSDKSEPYMHRYRFGHATALHNHEVWHQICIWLQPLSRGGTVGTMKSSSRVKYRHPKTGEKILHKIRKVVMIYPKELSEADEDEAQANHVDFSHRFSVRGHWRKVAGVGKNRQDEYCIQGFTFVREHQKGPEHLPLIKKTRVVLGNNKGDSSE